jgi:NADPH-dependent 2,4-dienoyl-CoA reductase/sulfur reductase-like enzyme/rhodanese-related sulfurtransferase
MKKRFIIVGGVAAGATAATRLRRLDEQAEIILVERGPNVSYANCGLPYYIGGEIAKRKSLFVTTKGKIKAMFGIDVREMTEVTEIDVNAKTVTLLDRVSGKSTVEPYTKLLLATGSSPIVPRFPGVDGDRVFTLWNIPDSDKMKTFVDNEKPKRAIVVGGGFVGLELLENLKSLGLEVSLVEMMTQVMAPLDPDMSKILENHLKDKGVNMYLGKGLVSIENGGRGITLDDGTKLDCDMVVLAIGVRPNNGLAKGIGVELNERGYVVTDFGMRTNVKDVYAAGDLIETIDLGSGERKNVPLAGPANKQGRVAADIMLADADDVSVDNTSRFNYSGALGTSIARVFDLTCASTGQNEKQLQKLGLKYGKDYSYSLVHLTSHAPYFPGATPLTVKLIFSMDGGTILGAQVVGKDGVDKRIDVFAASMWFGATVYDLMAMDLAYAPPYSSAKDPVNMAGYAASNILEGTSEPILWPEAIELAKDKENFCLLDIRENVEYEGSDPVKDSIHIPLSGLREALKDLDKSKTYMVFCAKGQRGYMGERIMRPNGFKVKNVLGGMSTHHTLLGLPQPPALFGAWEVE